MLEHQLTVGKTYRFTFKPEFERHGVCSSENVTCLHPGNGTFTLKQIASYGDVVAAGVDLFTNFFKPLGIKEDEYRQYFSGKPADEYTKEYTTRKTVTTDSKEETITVKGDDGSVQLKKIVRTNLVVKQNVVESGNSLLKKEYQSNLSYASYPIYKLVDIVNPDDILWVPEKALSGFPEVGLLNYKDIRLGINIGLWEDPQTLTPMLQSVRERSMAYGVPPLNIQLFTTGSKWMTREEYDTIKSIRLPGEEVTLTEENASQYTGKKILLNGEYATLVNGYSCKETEDTAPVAGKVYYVETDNGFVEFTGDTFEDGVVYLERSAGQALVTDLVKLDNFVIDNGLFMTELDPSSDTVFITDQKYYQRIGDGIYKQLIENKDWVSGDNIPHFILATSKVSGVPYYKLTGSDTYVPVGASVNYDYATKCCIAGIPIYIHTVEYQSCDETMTIDEAEVYYKRTADGEFVVADMTGVEALSEEYFVKLKDEYNEVVPETDADGVKKIPDAFKDEQFYVKGTTTATPIQESEYVQGSTYIRNPIYALNYSDPSALKCVGKKFSYVDHMDTKVTKELNASDVIMIATEKHPNIRINNSYASAKYNGRWFEYTATAGNGSTISKGDRIIVRVNTNSHELLSDVVGTIYGEKGSLWKDVVISNDGLMARNYFKLYQDELIKNAALAAKVDALQRLVNKMQNDLDTFHKKDV